MKLKKIVIALLACSLTVSQFSVPTYAKNTSKNVRVSGKVLEAAKKTTQKKQKTKEYVKGEAIVLFSEEFTKNAKKNAKDQAKFSSDITIKNIYNFSNDDGKVSLKGASGISFGDCVVASVKSNKLSTDKLIAKLKKNKNVEIAEPNYKVHASDVEDYSSYQWALNNTGQNAGDEGKDINADSLWKSGKTGTDRVIAIIDTGLDYNNAEFKERVWVNPKQARLPGLHGYDFANMDDDPIDDNGHGTHCCGIMAAATEKPQLGIQGVNQKAKLMPIKFLDSEGSGTLEGAVSAYNYLYQAQCLGVNVVAVNNSWGPVESSIFNSIVKMVGEKGAVSCFAAGNEAENNDEIFDVIGGDENPYSIVVAASNEKDELAGFSNYGKERVTLAAPGTDILSTVSYDCFNPSIYDGDLLADLCGTNHTDYASSTIATYNMVENEEDGKVGSFTADQEFGLPSMYICENGDGTAADNAEVQVSTDSQVFFGPNGKSLKISGKNIKEGQILSWAIPMDIVDTEQLSKIGFQMKTAGPDAIKWADMDGDVYDLPSVLYFGIMGEEEYNAAVSSSFADADFYYGVAIDGENNYWDQLEMEANDAESGRQYLVFSAQAVADGDFTVWLDDFAVTQGRKGEESQFGRYAFYNGTSMATPYVTGAVALLSSAYPNAQPDELVKLASASVRKSDNLKEKCQTEGVLDLSLVNDPAPVISKVSVDGNDTILIKGFGFKNGTKLKANGENVDVSLSKDGKTISFKGAKYLNKKLKLEISNDRGSVDKTVFLFSGKEMTAKGNIKDFVGTGDLLGWTTVATENKYYAFTTRSNANDYVYCMDADKKISTNKVSMASIFPNGDSETAGVYAGSNYAYLDDAIYMIAVRYDSVSNSSDYKLAQYDIATGKFIGVCDLPEIYDNIRAETIAAYNGELYVIGGYDYSTKNLSPKVMKYDVVAKKWSQAPSLPEGRNGGSCVQSGNSLVYSFGDVKAVKGKSTCPKPLIFDGKNWKISKATVNTDDYTEYSRTLDTDFHYYNARAALCKEGIIYVGLKAENLGDIFVYNVAKDCFEKSAYKISSKAKDIVDIAAIKNQLLAFDNCDGEGYDVYSMPINSGLLKVKADSTKKATLKLSKEEYLPGSTVTVKATAKKGYVIKSLTIDGKTYKGNTARFVIKKDTVVKINAVIYANKIKLNMTKATLKVGKKLKLKATVYPKNASSKKVKWICSNTKYATVSANGVVKAKKAGKGKTVTITCIALDGSKKVAKCKIKIK